MSRTEIVQVVEFTRVKCTRLSTVLRALDDKLAGVIRWKRLVGYGEQSAVAKQLEPMPLNAGGLEVYEFKTALPRLECYATRVHTRVWNTALPMIKILWEPTGCASAEANRKPPSELRDRDRMGAAVAMQRHINTGINTAYGDYAYAMRLQTSGVDEVRWTNRSGDLELALQLQADETRDDLEYAVQVCLQDDMCASDHACALRIQAELGK